MKTYDYSIVYIYLCISVQISLCVLSNKYPYIMFHLLQDFPLKRKVSLLGIRVERFIRVEIQRGVDFWKNSFKWMLTFFSFKLYFNRVQFYRSFGEIEGLSSREGKVLLLRDIIEDLSESMLESMQNPDHQYSREGRSTHYK